MNSSLLKKIAWPLGAVVLFLLVNVVYFSPQLQGKKLPMGDIEQYKGMAEEARAYQEETGETVLWTNSMFGGMPTYQLTAPQNKNLLKYVNNGFMLFLSRPIGYFVAAMLSMYILLLVLGTGHIIAIIGALAFGLATNGMVLFETGHTSKFMALAYTPMIIGGMLLVFKEKWLPGFALFTFSLGLNILSNHVQMTYYLFLVLGMIGLVELVIFIRKGKLAAFGKGAGILAIGVILAVGANAGKIWTTYEYSRDTMRGKPILEEKSSAEAESSSETEGLAWDYAMQWSNGYDDLAAGIVPRAVGGSNQEVVEDSEAIRRMRASGLRVPADIPIPLYWGSLPFTGGPVYFGALISFLFILSFFVFKGPMRWAILAGFILTLLISLGKNLSWFNQPLFDYLPLMNKFRAPSSILSVTAVLVPFFGALGISELLKRKKEGMPQLTRKIAWAGGITVGLWVLVALVMPSVSDFVANNDPAYGQQGWNLDGLRVDRKSALRSDSFRSLLFILLGFAAVWAFVKNWIKKPVLLAAIGILVVADEWGIASRYINSSDFVDARRLEASYTPRPCDLEILKDADLHYRVHDLTIDPFNSARTSYYHKTIGGYHAAKLQRYQDMIDRYISQGNMNVLNMLNTRYVITNNTQGEPTAGRNTSALGNAWFVDEIRMVRTPEQEINTVGAVEPGQTAVILDEFSEVLGDFDPQKAGTIELTEYTPNKLTYQSSAPSDQLAVFSEVWYGPDKGWEIRVDGEEIPLLRANYILRAAKVPAGQHTIEMEFRPKKYYLGEWLSLVCSLAILGIIGFVLYRGYTEVTKAKNLEGQKKKVTRQRRS